MGAMSARPVIPTAPIASSRSGASIVTRLMPNFDSHTREQLRRSYAEAWAKQLAGKPLVPLEALLCEVIGAHPEYQALLSAVATAQAFEPTAADQENPFLHMGLHVAVREQLAIDRPPGISALHRQLLKH